MDYASLFYSQGAFVVGFITIALIFVVALVINIRKARQKNSK